MLLNIFVAGVFQSKAQQPLFSYCGPLEPSQVRCCQNDNVELFREYLSLFKVNGKQKRSQIDSFEWWNPKWEPIDSQYEQFVFKVPGFFVYPAFRIDCKNGFLVGLKNGYACDKMRLYYVDLVSYDKSGRIIGRTTLPTFQMANFHTDDSCGYSYQQLLSRLDIENGLIIFEFGTLRACYSDLERADTIISETIVKEGRKYVYRIEDDASLTLISATEPQENQ